MQLDMDKRLRDMPIMASRPDKIEAYHYNLWRRSRNRWGAPMRLSLPGLKEICMFLNDDYWVCVDTTKYNVPVLAWVGFENHERMSLHQPIPCSINYYHFAASAIRAKALDLMGELLTERLSEEPV